MREGCAARGQCLGAASVGRERQRSIEINRWHFEGWRDGPRVPRESLDMIGMIEVALRGSPDIDRQSYANAEVDATRRRMAHKSAGVRRPPCAPHPRHRDSRGHGEHDQ